MHKDSKILIVDDFPVMRRIIENLWKKNGYINFVHAENGQQGMEKLAQHDDIKFICSDWNMPVLSGLGFLKLTKSDPRFTHIPFLMITAEAKRSQILEAAKCGVDGYIVKPFTEDQLMEKVSKILSRLSKKETILI